MRLGWVDVVVREGRGRGGLGEFIIYWFGEGVDGWGVDEGCGMWRSLVVRVCWSWLWCGSKLGSVRRRVGGGVVVVLVFFLLFDVV